MRDLPPAETQPAGTPARPGEELLAGDTEHSEP